MPLVRNNCLTERASPVVPSTPASSSCMVTLAKLWQKTRTFHSGSRARSTFTEGDRGSLQSIGSLLLLEAAASILPAVPSTELVHSSRKSRKSSF